MATQPQHIEQIREWMISQNLDAFIIPHEDEYLSEYIPPQNERLDWVSGFNGSAGVAVVLSEKAAIFVDGRYTVQVRNQVDENIFEFQHLKSDPYLNWLIENCKQDARVGYDPRLHRAGWLKSAQKLISDKLSLVVIDDNPIDSYWTDRPSPNNSPLLLLDEKYHGRNSQLKREDIGELIKSKNCDVAFLTRLDSIAWLLNIRGKDVPCNPVLLSHAILYNDGRVELFIDSHKIPDGFHTHVGERVSVLDPSNLKSHFQNLKGKTVLLDKTGSNVWSMLQLENAGATIINLPDPCLLPKACKNETEVQGMKDCHIRDAVAVCTFLSWIEDVMANGQMPDEGILSDKLDSIRAEQDLFKGVSFGTISAAGPNAAMCHYSHKNQDIPGQLKMDSVYLVDSGGQYLDGTTDITRTIAIGNPNSFIKKMFTLVLKGHIALGSARFPSGIGGQHLDSLARQFLWHHGYDFDHGTGHGVGCYLNVHEGPHRIGKGSNDVPLEPSMIVSNEPGYYEANKFGIRCENLVLVKESNEANGTPLYEFENLTFVPFDTRLLDYSLLSQDEIQWINSYHQAVLEKVGPHVNGSVLDWLKGSTQSI